MFFLSSSIFALFQLFPNCVCVCVCVYLNQFTERASTRFNATTSHRVYSSFYRVHKSGLIHVKTGVSPLVNLGSCRRVMQIKVVSWNFCYPPREMKFQPRDSTFGIHTFTYWDSWVCKEVCCPSSREVYSHYSFVVVVLNLSTPWCIFNFLLLTLYVIYFL